MTPVQGKMPAASPEPTRKEGAEECTTRTKAMYDAQDFAGAAREGTRALEISGLADVALMRARALLHPLIDPSNLAKHIEEATAPQRIDFEEAYVAYRLALIMDKDNKEAAYEASRVEQLLQCTSRDELLKQLGALPPDAKETNGHDHDYDHSAHHHHHHPEAGPDAGHDAGPDPELDVDLDYDVLIVGAGAAGIGCAIMLTGTFGVDPSRVVLIERGEAVGTSFRKWPEEMRFISPSFNQQGWTRSFDLNAVAYHKTPPAFTLQAEHPSGEQYADYLSWLAESSGLRVKLSTDVVATAREGGVFGVRVRTRGDDGVPREETLRSRFVVWAAGEFQYPRESTDKLPGADLCVHNSRVQSWARLPGDDYVIIGGYESGARAERSCLGRVGRPDP